MMSVVSTQCVPSGTVTAGYKSVRAEQPKYCEVLRTPNGPDCCVLGYGLQKNPQAVLVSLELGVLETPPPF